MLKKIISGCQTGADIAGVDAAIAQHFPYDGWVPFGRRTEAGPLDEKYQVKEMTNAGYPPRTRKNIIDSDGTVIFTHGKLSGGSALTRKIAIEHKKPWLHLNMNEHTADDAVKNLFSWIELHGLEVLNVAGRSGSKDPKIYSVVFSVIHSLLEKTICNH